MNMTHLHAKHVTRGGTETLEIYDDESQAEVERRVERTLRNGGKVRHEDGSVEFIVTATRFDSSKSGSAAYTWHADGDRVLVDRVRRTIAADGETVLREQHPPPVWRAFS